MTARVIREIFALRVLADHGGGGPTKVGGRRQEARPERPGQAWPIPNRLAGARVWPRRPATSPRVPRSRADPSVWPGRELRRTAGRCPATAAPRPWRRLRLLRQIRDELVAGVEQFLFVDDGVAVEDRPAFVPGQAYGDPVGHAGADQGAGGGAGGNRGGSGSARRPPGRRCATPCASGGWGCRRGGRRAGW